MRLAPLTASILTRRARRRPARAALAAGSALLLAGCHIPGTSGSDSASAQGSITVGVVPGTASAALYVGLQTNAFKQHGLAVTVRSYPNAAAELTALNKGQVTVAEGDYANFLYAQANSAGSNSGSALRLIADGYDAAPDLVQVLVLPGSNITTPQQLVGKSIATPPRAAMRPPSNADTATSSSSSNPGLPYSMEMLATESVLQGDGVSPSSVTWRAMPMGNMIAALRNHGVEAILVTEPYIFEAESELGAVEVLDSCSGATSGIPLAGYFSQASYARGNGPLLHAFQAALSAAQSAAAMRGPVSAALTRYSNVKKQDASLVSLGVYPTFLNVGQVQRVAQLLYESGAVSSLVNVKNMIFTS